MEVWKKRLYDCYISSGQAGEVVNKNPKLKVSNYPFYIWLIKKHLNKNRSINIADLGCGHGALLFVLKSLGYTNIVGVDISSEQVTLAKEIGVEEVVHSDLLEFLDQSERNFDVIFLMDILEHLSKDQMFLLLDKVYSKLNEDGTLIVHVPNADGLFGMRVRYGDLTHETCFNPSSLRQIISACHFKKIICLEQTPVVHGFISFVRYLVWKSFTIFPRLLLLAETGVGGHVLSQNLLAIVRK